MPSRPTLGFTMIELMIAIGLGLLVAIVAYASFATAAETITTVRRMALDNRLMRAGVAAALDEVDYWTVYDDPDDTANQGLRQIQRGDGFAAPDMTTGLPFTALQAIPLRLETAPAGWQLRATDPALASEADLTSDAWLASADADRGFDPRRPYQANDPRRWYHGNIAEMSLSDRRFGRYALFDNQHKNPRLGYGHDPREIRQLDRWGREMEPGAATSRDPNSPVGAPLFRALTGPYGEIDGTRVPSRVHTWHGNQLIFLHDAMGNYGLCDYVPANAMLATHGTYAQLPRYGNKPNNRFIGTHDDHHFAESLAEVQARWASQGFKQPYATALAQGTIETPRDGYLRIDEQAEVRFTGLPAIGSGFGDFFPESFLAPQAKNSSNATAATLRSASSRSIPLIPVSPYTGAWVVGYLHEFPTQWGDTGGAPNSSLSLERIMTHHRSRWMNRANQTFQLTVMMNRMTAVSPLLAHRPKDWPILQLQTQRFLNNGRFVNNMRVRWTDPASNETAEISFNGLGTTLRGARQQRRPGGGWAAWYGPGDSRNNETLDAPP
ncbi:MAG: prepilin-type N-terminal cleavage/methylation domain-containing protein [Planctomycetota bacterium]|jgi:hypothetical protein|nr:prepilin-type N-terminal cleavage/methylation domain-containing protein [Planctomycetota bacterium]